MRHVEGLALNNIEFRVEKPDLRPVLICEDAADITIEGLNAPVFSGSETALRVEDSQDIRIDNYVLAGTSDALLTVTGTSSHRIILTSNNMDSIKTKHVIVPGKGTPEDAVIFHLKRP